MFYFLLIVALFGHSITAVTALLSFLDSGALVLISVKSINVGFGIKIHC